MRYSRARRLSHASEIELVRRTGKRMRTGHLEVRVAASPSRPEAEGGGGGAHEYRGGTTPGGRVGVIVPKYGRRVVDRNLVRRRLRELVRTRLLPVMPASHDVLIRALPQAYRATFDTLAVEIDGIAARLG